MDLAISSRSLGMHSSNHEHSSRSRSALCANHSFANRPIPAGSASRTEQTLYIALTISFVVLHPNLCCLLSASAPEERASDRQCSRCPPHLLTSSYQSRPNLGIREVPDNLRRLALSAPFPPLVTFAHFPQRPTRSAIV